MALTADEMRQVVEALLPLIRPQQQPQLLGTVLTADEFEITGLSSSAFKQILPSDPNRVMVGFMSAVAGSLKISIKTGPVATTGFTLTTTANPVFFNVKDHGVLPQLQWNAADPTGGTATLVVFTVTYHPKG